MIKVYTAVLLFRRRSSIRNMPIRGSDFPLHMFIRATVYVLLGFGFMSVCFPAILNAVIELCSLSDILINTTSKTVMLNLMSLSEFSLLCFVLELTPAKSSVIAFINLWLTKSKFNVAREIAWCFDRTYYDGMCFGKSTSPGYIQTNEYESRLPSCAWKHAEVGYISQVSGSVIRSYLGSVKYDSNLDLGSLAARLLTRRATTRRSACNENMISALRPSDEASIIEYQMIIVADEDRVNSWSNGCAPWLHQCLFQVEAIHRNIAQLEEVKSALFLDDGTTWTLHSMKQPEFDWSMYNQMRGLIALGLSRIHQSSSVLPDAMLSCATLYVLAICPLRNSRLVVSGNESLKWHKSPL